MKCCSIKKQAVQHLNVIGPTQTPINHKEVTTMSSLKVKSLMGPTQHLTLRHPLATRSPIWKYGMPIGIDVFSRELICLDPAWDKMMGYIDSMFFLFFGVKGYGKSSTLKILLIRLAMLTAGFEELRVAINDHKVLKQDRADGSREHGMEYDSIAHIMGCTPFVMSRMRVNPFDYRICKTYSQLLAMAQLLASFSTTDKLDVRTKRALRVAVLRMYYMNRELWSPAMLLDIIRTLREEDVDVYHRRARRLLIVEHSQRRRRLKATSKFTDAELRKLDVEFKDQLAREVTISTPETLAAKEKLFDLLDDVFSGPDAEIFGDSHSMFDMYGQRACVKQWVGFASGGDGETIMRTLDAQLKTFIIENGMTELLPHMELNDELHKGLANPVSAEAIAWLSKIARSLPLIWLGASQRPTDLLKGLPDSPHYRAGESILDDNGATFLARMRGKPAFLDELQERYMLTAPQRVLLPNLPKYTMFLKGSEEHPATLMRVFATAAELPLLKTDQSNEQLLMRPGIGSIEAIEAYANANGVRLLDERTAELAGARL